MFIKIYISFREFVKGNNFIRGILYPLILWRRRRIKRQRIRYNTFYNQSFDAVEEGSLVVHIKDLKGAFEIDVRSHILRRILENKEYEPEIVSLIKKNIDPKKDVVDIGANIGLYTILFSKLIDQNCKVLSIEPTPGALKYLSRNIRRNNSSQSVIRYKGIATNQKGNFKINTIEGMEEYSSVGQIVHSSVQNKSYKSIEVEGDTVDNLVKRFNLSPGMLKIDTEGAEYQVFCGALSTIKKYKPVIICELSDKLLSKMDSNSTMVLNLLKQNRYRIISIEHPHKPIIVPFEGDILAICS